MPDPASPIARLRPARRRCAPRRFAERPKIHFIVLSSVPAGQRTRGRGHRTFAWTLYSRFQWALATARAERERRRYRPSWE